jgi:1,4-dihydroxy-2-naphthoate octaprenyltransferase
MTRLCWFTLPKRPVLGFNSEYYTDSYPKFDYTWVNMPEKPDALSPFHIWMLAARPKTLPAAVAPVIVGAAVALGAGQFRAGPALAALVAALLLQIGANLANDVFDFYRGSDTEQRLGPLRVTQAGLLSPAQVLLGMWVIFGLAALLGVYLIRSAGWPVLWIGLASILAAVAYSGGPLPFGYYGLGDVAVFLFFGPVAVCGTYFVQAGEVTPQAVAASIPMGLLTTAILVVNNLRDIATDRAAKKRTLAVRLGEAGTRWEYALCLVLAYLAPLGFAMVGLAPWGGMLAWLSVPYALKVSAIVWKQAGRPLNQALAGTGQLELFFGLLFGLGWTASVLLQLL